MSWISITVIFVFACLLCALGACEWIVKRRVGDRRNDRDSLT
jgi:hypothetical protein